MTDFLLTLNTPFLSYDVPVIQWITSCYKNRIATQVIELWRIFVRSLTDKVHVNNAFLIEIIGDKSLFKGSYDKQNLTLVVISYEVYETRQGLVS